MTSNTENFRANWEAAARSAFSRYRIMAFVTGGFLLLLVLEMVLKYVFQLGGVGANGEALPVLGTWIAIVHGWIYAIYAITVFQLWLKMRWSFGKLVLLIAGGVVPVLSFVMEARAHKWFAADLPALLDRAERLAAASGQ
ncbi:MAG: DUF3817 domain-containing protein [Ruaniaceae bacterium]|nr:DUF3817 domain-containing protein [Ruaniaceae bacterium]